jgi:hypothetical protein
MLYDILRPTRLKIILITIIFLVFTATFTLNIINSQKNKTALPSSLNKLTVTDYVSIAAVIVFLPISWLSPWVNKMIYTFQLPVTAGAVVSVIFYTLTYYLLFSILFFLLIKWYKSD